MTKKDTLMLIGFVINLIFIAMLILSYAHGGWLGFIYSFLTMFFGDIGIIIGKSLENG
jgi:hypothetical protein